MTVLIDQATDVFCEKLARIDAIGPNRRLIFTVSSTEGPGYDQVAVKLVLSADAMVEIAQMVAADVHTPRAFASLSADTLAN